MSSGNNIQAGRITTGESTTDLVGALPDQPDVPFNGPTILRVGPQQNSFVAPSQQLDGIWGIGCTSFDDSTVGNPMFFSNGVKGVGNGAGVFGLGVTKISEPPVPSVATAAGTGVEGQGAKGFSGDFSAAVAPGTGVIGHGGMPMIPDFQSSTGAPPDIVGAGAGVVGMAGGVMDLSFPAIANTGVVGIGSPSILVDNPGFPQVVGNAPGRGGIFGSASNSGKGAATVAQLQLLPADTNLPLPTAGAVGDLYVGQFPAPSIGPATVLQGALFFCIQASQGTSPALWAPLQLGTPVAGGQ